MMENKGWLRRKATQMDSNNQEEKIEHSTIARLREKYTQVFSEKKCRQIF